MAKKIPPAYFAVIGGSGTFSINFPEDLGRDDVQVREAGMTFSTPFGESPSFKLFTIGEKQVLTVKMHGWRHGTDRAGASRQLFWVLKAAGVKKIIAEGGAGSINRLLRPRDLLVPDDYLDFSMRKDVSLGGEYLLIMRQPVCPQVSKELVAAAESHTAGRVFERGVYAVTEGRHFESAAEIEMLGRLGADIVGQSMCPEVYLAREVGACYGRLDLVVNYAEGIIREWDHLEMTELFYNEPLKIGNIVLDAMSRLSGEQVCNCPELRKTSLLKEKK